MDVVDALGDARSPTESPSQALLPRRTRTVKSDKPRQHVENQKHHFADKGPSSQSYGFSSSHVWLWELDHEDSWAPKNWCFWAEVLDKTYESPLDSKEIKPVNPKGNQSWIFIARTDAEAEAPILWPPDVKSWLLKTALMLGKIEGMRYEEKGTTEDEMVGWHHWLNGHEFEQTPGDSERGKPGVLQFTRKELDMTQRLNSTNNKVWHSEYFRLTTIQIQKLTTVSRYPEVTSSQKSPWGCIRTLRISFCLL